MTSQSESVQCLFSPFQYQPYVIILKDTVKLSTYQLR